MCVRECACVFGLCDSFLEGMRDRCFSCVCIKCSVFVSIVVFGHSPSTKHCARNGRLNFARNVVCTMWIGRKTRRQSIIGQWSTYPINGVFKFRKPFNLRLILFVVCCNCCCDWDCTGDLLICISCCGCCCVSNCCICCNCCSLLAAKRK